MLSFDTVAIHEQFLRTIRDAQSDNGDVPGAVPIGPRGTLAAAEQVEAARITDISWSAAFPLITSWLYLYHGDVGIVEEMYPALAEFVDFLNNAALSEPGKLADFFIWGDWCAVQVLQLSRSSALSLSDHLSASAPFRPLTPIYTYFVFHIYLFLSLFSVPYMFNFSDAHTLFPRAGQ